MTPQLSIAVVLYKTSRNDIRNFLKSLTHIGYDLRIYVIDNSPTADLQGEFVNQNVLYKHMPSNPGFGTAHNVGLKLSIDEGMTYHLVVNSDVSFDDDVITPMIDYMERNPKVGQMMPRVKNADGSLQRLCKLVPTPADLLFRRLLPKRLMNRRQKRFELHESGYNKIMFVPFLSGCFMLLRNQAIKEVGGFDERFFMYGEDIDMTRRIAEKYETVFFPHVNVTHGYEAASRKSLRMFLIHAWNIGRYFNKWGWFHDPVRDRLNQRTLAQFTAQAD